MITQEQHDTLHEFLRRATAAAAEYTYHRLKGSTFRTHEAEIAMRNLELEFSVYVKHLQRDTNQE